MSGLPERDSEPRDFVTGWERSVFVCGCGRGCLSWPDHHGRREAEAQHVDREDVSEEIAWRREQEEGA